MNSDLTLARQVGEIARAAAAAILPIYHSDFAVQTKADASPVTAADLAAQRIILAGLAELHPALPVVSEEAYAPPWPERQQWSRYWLVDPLDGTREFVKRNGEFTVNIALVEKHRSVLGVVLAPVTGELYVAAHGAGAWLQMQPGAPWQPLSTRPLARPGVLAGSRSHGSVSTAVLDALLGAEHQRMAMGSSLKFCLLARGVADVYLRLGATSEWDTGAAQCVLDEAGGALLDLHGDMIMYNRKASLLNPEFIAVGDTTVDWVARLRRAGL
ncbi:MAG: 3'(2'),5'-bisphosphate nucleotidase CysQ [Rhodanobacter sp.]